MANTHFCSTHLIGMTRPARYELADWLLKGVAVLLAFGLVVGLLVWMSEVLAARFA